MIQIKNIYYMLTYVYQFLNEGSYRNIELEKFESAEELYAAILVKVFSSQLKKGLEKHYISKSEELSLLRGKINISQSIKNMSFIRGRIFCSHDKFLADTLENQIIKETMRILLSRDISKNIKKEIKKLIIFLNDVSKIDIKTINWRLIDNCKNKTIQMLLFICNLIIYGYIQTNKNGNFKMKDFIEDIQMSKLYEKFILEYYKKEHPELKVTASQIKWQTEEEGNTLLPIMKTDIMLQKENRYLIIDAKYYSKIMRKQYEIEKLHSNNLYQIFTYVKNKEYELKNKESIVSGMLLYAKTDEEKSLDSSYNICGNNIEIKTLDLNCNFNSIKEQLEEIVRINFALNKYILEK